MNKWQLNTGCYRVGDGGRLPGVSAVWPGDLAIRARRGIPRLRPCRRGRTHELVVDDLPRWGARRARQVPDVRLRCLYLPLWTVAEGNRSVSGCPLISSSVSGWRVHFSLPNRSGGMVSMHTASGFANGASGSRNDAGAGAVELGFRFGSARIPVGNCAAPCEGHL